MGNISFNRPTMTGRELEYISEAIAEGHIAGDGEFSKKCHALIEEMFGIKNVLLTTSGTAALEMAAILCDIGPGDEVILPSFTFVSTANAFCLRGAKLVFVDIDEKTLNLNTNLIERRITSKTKAVVPVHYAGIGCDMDRIIGIAEKHKLFIIEDAALAFNSKYKNRFLGTIGNLGIYSFHETKNLVCGEGGAILINDEGFKERAEIIREKGTNRSKFFRGQVDKYTWVDIGSSYLPSDILAAFLLAQLEHTDDITRARKRIYEYYYQNLLPIEQQGLLKLPTIPDWCEANYSMFYIILPTEEIRDKMIYSLKMQGISAVFHYLPLHLAPAGKRFGYNTGDLPVTEEMSGRLLRLPFYNDLKEIDQERVIKALSKILTSTKRNM